MAVRSRAASAAPAFQQEKPVDENSEEGLKQLQGLRHNFLGCDGIAGWMLFHCGALALLLLAPLFAPLL
jgi:hypothetical protein